jgi:hypothetical protein
MKKNYKLQNTNYNKKKDETTDYTDYTDFYFFLFVFSQLPSFPPSPLAAGGTYVSHISD